MATAAYDLHTSKHSSGRPAPRVRVVRGGRYGLGKARQTARTVLSLLVCALVLGLIVSVVQSQARITELSGEIEAARRDLSAAQSDYDYLSTTMSSITSRTNVADIAEGDLGLVKADGSQITYIRLEDESVLEKTTGSAAKLLEGVRTAALSLIGTLDP